MSEEGFLRRWARRKSEIGEGRIAEPAHAPPPAPAHPPAPVPAVDAAVAEVAAPLPAPPLPTMEDVASLGADSDFSAFVARGVDQAVRRSALKKLFADPHFNVMDQLDIYIDDYTKASPVSEAMLASFSHAKSTLMRVVEEEAPPESPAESPAESPPQAQAAPAAPLQQPPEQETQ